MEMQSSIGVIVGRFQFVELRDEQRDAIEGVIKKHDQVLVFIETSPVPVTKCNPLDFHTRKNMLLQYFPGLRVFSIPDQPLMTEWSKDLDKRIYEANPKGNAVLYGTGNGSIGSYSGRFEKKELSFDIESNAGAANIIEQDIKTSKAFRVGIVYAADKQYSKVYPTVDVAVFHGEKLLLAKKPSVNSYRFIGGFSDPSDSSYEEAAKREVLEEADIGISDLEYVGSARVDDWRYRNEKDKIITTLFIAKYVSGSINPQDDISELRWFDWGEVSAALFVDEHRPLFEMLKKRVNASKV